MAWKPARGKETNQTGLALIWPVTGNQGSVKQTDGTGVVAATPESISRADRRFSSGPRMVPIVISEGPPTA